MAVLDLVQGQKVNIPAIQLTNGTPLSGLVRAVQGDTIALEVDPAAEGLIPPKVEGNCVLTWKCGEVQRACPVLVRSKSQRAMVVQAVIQERRESPRLRAEVRMVYETVPAEQVSETANEVMAKLNPLGEPIIESAQLLRGMDDPLERIRQDIAGLRLTMDLLMTKLDQLTMLVLSGEKPKQMPQIKKPLAIVNCSSTGIGFLAAEPFEQGQYLRLHLTLCTAPQVEIDCMGVVVRSNPLDIDPCNPDTARYDTGIRYTHIHESDREHLIHYLFKVQRRLLRDMKEAREDLG